MLDIIQRSISSKLREEWSAEFFDFYNLPTLTPEEVTKGMEKDIHKQTYQEI